MEVAENTADDVDQMVAWAGQTKDVIPESPLLRRIRIFIIEGWAVIRHVIPNIISWSFYRKMYRYEEFSIVVDGVNKIGTLTLVQGKKVSNEIPILLMHGDQSFSSNFYNLLQAIRAQYPDRPVYCLDIPHVEDETDQEAHHLIFAEAVRKVQSTFNHVIVGGHSKGAQLASYGRFCNNLKNTTVISIAGRVAIPPGDESPHSSIRPMVKKIEQAIRDNPQIPFYQIAADRDWIAPPGAFNLRTKTFSLVSAMHLNILFSLEMHRAFLSYVAQIDRDHAHDEGIRMSHP